MEEKNEIPFAAGDEDKEEKPTPPAKKESLGPSDISHKKNFGANKNYQPISQLSKQTFVKSVVVLKQKFDEEECVKRIVKAINTNTNFDDTFLKRYKFASMELVWVAIAEVDCLTDAYFSQAEYRTDTYYIDYRTRGVSTEKTVVSRGSDSRHANGLYHPFYGNANFVDNFNIFAMAKYSKSDVINDEFNESVYFDEKLYEQALEDIIDESNDFAYPSDVNESYGKNSWKTDPHTHDSVEASANTETNVNFIVMPIYSFSVMYDGVEYKQYVNAFTGVTAPNGKYSEWAIKHFKENERKKKRKDRNYKILNALIYLIPFIVVALVAPFPWGKDYWLTAVKIWNNTFSWLNPDWDIYGLLAYIPRVGAVLWTGLQLIFLLLPFIAAWIATAQIHDRKTPEYNKKNAILRILFSVLFGGVGIGILYVIVYLIY